MLWAYHSSTKFAIGFSPFSLVYRTEVVSPVELKIPSLRVLQARKKENEKNIFMVERCEDLKRLAEKREEALEHSCKYRQRMMEAYGKAIEEMMGIIAWPKWMEMISQTLAMENGSSVITPEKYYVVFFFFFFMYYLSFPFCIPSK